ncbi:MAG: hypothetical protein AAFR41_08455 [Pseudomonadota bacterium]
MEIWVKGAWALLALVHLSPAAAAFSTGVVRQLYGVSPEGDLGVLLAHRGALFLAILAACLCAILDPSARRALSLVVSISVIGFLILFVRAGAPVGPLRTIAIIDAIALVPLFLVAVSAWRAS